MSSDTPTVVARSRSRQGGRCEWPGCTAPVAAGEDIAKLDTGARGGTTSGGHGYGAWVHAWHVSDPTD